MRLSFLGARLSPPPPAPFGVSPIGHASAQPSPGAADGMAALLDDYSIDASLGAISPPPRIEQPPPPPCAEQPPRAARCLAVPLPASAPSARAASSTEVTVVPMSSDDIMASLMAEAMQMIEAKPAAESTARGETETGSRTLTADEASPALLCLSVAANEDVSSRGPSTAMLIDRGRQMSSLPAVSPPPPLAAESRMTLAGVFDEAFDESSLDGATMFVDAADSRVEQRAALERSATAPQLPKGPMAQPPSPVLPELEAPPAAPVASPAFAPAAPAAAAAVISSDAELRAELETMRAEQERLRVRCREAEEANWKLTDEWQVELAKNAALQQRIVTLQREAESAPAPASVPKGAVERAPTVALKTPRSRLARAEDTRNSPRVNDLETHLGASRQKCNALQSSLSGARTELATLRERCAALDLAALQRTAHVPEREQGGELEQQLLATREISEELQAELQSALRDKVSWFHLPLHFVRILLTI